VTEKPYVVARLDDLERFPVDDEGLVWRPVRRRLGIQAFGTNAYTAAQAGDRVVEEHFERGGHEELYFVARGHATFTVGDEDEEVDAPQGTLMFARPGTKRGAVAVEAGTTVLAFGAKPGVPHEVSKWEAVFAAFGHLRNGDEDAGRKELEAALAAYPGEWQGHYNAACFESLTSNPGPAIEHLKRAIELSPEAAEAARKDSDLDLIRDHPEFPA
jgi:mannose-6-phosphate isomerase-like protein (cupin superfamily)